MARTKLQLTPVSSATEDLDLKTGNNHVPIEAIRLRRVEDVRPLSASHVAILAESIAALSILEPIVVDLQGYLLAGGHRLAALQLLAEPDGEARRKLFLGRVIGAAVSDPKADAAEGAPPGKEPTTSLATIADNVAAIDVTSFAEKYPKGKVPVMAIDTAGTVGPGLDLAVEAAENGIRKQYGRDEIQHLAKKLEKAGYRTREGRPKTGEKSARPVLEALTGLSPRQLTRLLNPEEESKRGKSPADLAEAALKRAASRYLVAAKGRKSDRAQALLKLAEKVVGETGSK